MRLVRFVHLLLCCQPAQPIGIRNFILLVLSHVTRGMVTTANNMLLHCQEVPVMCYTSTTTVLAPKSALHWR